jgi:AcrR family transcriptional regulator
MRTGRLTREEKRRETRSRLLEAAATVFAERGYSDSSLEEVAEKAGFSKGAVYSNFSSKEDLMWALLEDFFESRKREISEALADADDPEERAAAATRQFLDVLRQRPQIMLLFIEFWAYAVRRPQAKQRFVSLLGELRQVLAELIRQRSRQFGVRLSIPEDQVAIALGAMAQGFAMEKLSQPERATDDLYALMIAGFLRALVEDVERLNLTPERRWAESVAGRDGPPVRHTLSVHRLDDLE